MPFTPGTYSFSAARGATVNLEFRLKYTESGDPATITTDHKVRAQIRTEEGATGNSTASTLLLDLTEDNGRLTVLARTPQARIGMTLSSEDTVLLCEENELVTRYWSLELFDDSEDPEVVTPLLKGAICMQPEITR